MTLLRCGGAATAADPSVDGGPDAHVARDAKPDVVRVDAAPMCPSGEIECGIACVDTMTSATNCGACGEGCGAGLVCEHGKCGCAGSEILCGGTCIEAVDDDHCGTCSTQCTGGAHCSGGACSASAVQHVILIVQENHTFDAYFGNYCQAPTGSDPTCTVGPSCCERAPATTPDGTTLAPLDDAFNMVSDRNHSQACEIEEIDSGKMDRYTSGSDIAGTTCTVACSSTINAAIADGASPGGLIAPYWQFADANALADRYFQPIQGSSSSNDMYFAIAHEQFIDNAYSPPGVGADCDDPTGLNICGVDAPVKAFVGRTTIVDVLRGAGRTVGVYGDGYAEAVAAAPSCASVPPECPYSSFLHPELARSCLYDPTDFPFQYYAQLNDDPTLFFDYTRLATDLANGTLPDFAFVKGRTFHNEHPEFSTISDGVTFVTQTIADIAASSYAASTLILLTWDEGGGFYDHVSPPEFWTPPVASTDVLDDGTPVLHGTRVPMLAIGPFAAKGVVSHVVMDHASILRFLEYNFVGPVGQLGYSDAIVNNLGSLLDPSTTGIVIPAGK